MGISGMSPGSLIIIFLIIILLFGTKKLRTMGKDFGEALKGFREGLKEGSEEKKQKIDGE